MEPRTYKSRGGIRIGNESMTEKQVSKERNRKKCMVTNVPIEDEVEVVKRIQRRS